MSQTATLEGKAYFNFINSLKSEFTKQHYRLALIRFLRHYNLDINTLVKTEPKDIETLLIDYIVLLKGQKKSRSSINVITSAVTHFCVMNDINIMTKKICKFKGEDETKHDNDRGYSHEEIQLLVNVSPLRLKMVFLVMASTGIRVGALPGLRLRHLKKVDDKNLYQFTIYANSPQRYVTYCTPECATVIDSYLAYRERFGEKLNPDSFLLRKDFDINDLEQIKKKSEPVSYSTLKVIVRNYTIKTGIQTPSLDGYKRHEVPVNHGFRKFAESRLIESDVNPMAVMRLIGHKGGGVDNKSYFRPKEGFILSEYEKAIDALTIDPANQLRKKVEKLEVERSQFDKLAAKIASLERKIK